MKTRLEELLSNCIEYIYEIKDHEIYDKEERMDFWKTVIGLTEEEIQYYKVG